MRIVCHGDSFTAGLADDLRPDGEYLGWADRVATALAEMEHVEYANLAVRGKLLDQVVREQVPVAEALAPDLLTFHAGGNDVLRRGADLPALSRYNDAVAGSRPPTVASCCSPASLAPAAPGDWRTRSRPGSPRSTTTSGTWPPAMAPRCWDSTRFPR